MPEPAAGPRPLYVCVCRGECGVRFAARLTGPAARIRCPVCYAARGEVVGGPFTTPRGVVELVRDPLTGHFLLALPARQLPEYNSWDLARPGDDEAPAVDLTARGELAALLEFATAAGYEVRLAAWSPLGPAPAARGPLL